MKRIYQHYLGANAQSYYRQLLPARHCESSRLEFKTSSKFTAQDLEVADAFVFPRLIDRGFMPAIEAIKARGKRFVWELDDDVWNLPTWNPAHKAYDAEALERIAWTAEMADEIIVSTQPLADSVLEQTGREAVVLPNLIDLDDWPSDLPPREEGRPVRILWAGSRHHLLDLEVIVPALERLLEEYGEKILVLFWGDVPDSMSETIRLKYSHLTKKVPLDRYAGRVGVIDPVSLSCYPQTACDIAPDIALAPLCDDTFNYSKSGIKWMEMSMAGAVVVASDMPPYWHVTRDSGIRVKPDGWYEAVKGLIDDDVRRDCLAFLGRLEVLDRHSWQVAEDEKGRWVEFFREVA